MRPRTRSFTTRSTNGVSKIRRMDYKKDWPVIAREVKQRDGNKCKICGGTNKLEVHHIIPLSRGGTNSKANLITLCEKHHDARHRHLR